MDPTASPGIRVGQVFLESVSFSHRKDFLALPPETRPELGAINLQIQAAVGNDERNGFLRAEVSTSEGRIYQVKLAMVALFEQQEGQENMPVREFLNGPAIALLYPFLREAFASITLRGRFGPVWLEPFNVQALAAKLRDAEAETRATGAGSEGNAPVAPEET